MHIKIRVITESRKDVVKKVSDEHYEISVTEPAKGNRANNKILEIIRSLHPMAVIRIVSGHHSPNKIMSVENDMV